MKATRTSIPPARLRAAANGFAARLPAIVETSMDGVVASSSDPLARRRALLFKMDVVPAIYQAAFHPGPLAACLDLWSFSIQLLAWTGSAAGRASLGDVAPAALEAARRVRNETESGLRDLSTGRAFEDAKARVEAWAAAHPMTGPVAERPSILPRLAEMAGDMGADVFESVEEINASLADLAVRLDIYASYAPKAARWQAELLGADFAARDDVRLALATLDSVRRTTDRTHDLLAPGAFREALAELSGAVRAERMALLADIGRQRAETLDRVSNEVQSLLAGAEKQRVSLLGDVERQRLHSLESIEALRERTLEQAEATANRVLLRAGATAALLLVFAALLATSILRKRRDAP